MGGSSGSVSTKGAPAQAQPIDFNALMGSAGTSAAQALKQQYQSMIENYPAMERLQLGTAQNVAGMLSEEGGPLYSWKQVGKGKNATWEQVQVGTAAPNEYTKQARLAVEDALGQRGAMGAQADALAGLGDYMAQQGRAAMDASGPNAIETELQRQAAADLALGRALSPEQLREAQQAARSSMASRGLGQSAATAAAEILNRDAYASQREAERRNFAGATNSMVEQNTLARRGQAGEQLGLAGNLIGNAATGYQNVAGLGLQGAQSSLAVDPVQRGLAPGLGLASSTMGTMGSMTSNTYGNAIGAAANVAGFNANMLDSRYNNYMNNQAALQASRMQQQGALTSGLMGLGGSVAAGLMFSDRRMKKDVKRIGQAAGSVLGLPAYEFRYKDGGGKRIGLMAQDVQKVLPEAVTEVDFKGKKRLAIRPEVIGQAVARELAA